MTRDEPDYHSLFERYIKRSVERLLDRIDQARAALPLEDRLQILHTLNYALSRPTAWPFTRQLLLAAAPHMEQAGHQDDWLPYLKQGRQLSQANADWATLAELELQVGILYQRRTDYEVARQHMTESALHFVALGDSQNQARSLNRLAYLSRLQGQLDEAVSLVHSALKHPRMAAPERAYSYHVLALVTFEKRHWHMSVMYSKLSYGLWQGSDDWRMMGRSLINEGSALHRLESYPAAIQAYQRALSLFKEAADPLFQAITEMNLGNVYITLHQPDEALHYYQPAERVFRQAQDRLHTAMINHNIGMACHQLQQWTKAETAYLNSIVLKYELGNIASLVNTMSELGATYLAQGQTAQAAVILHEALAQLERITNHPRHDFLWQTVTGQLRQVTVREPAPTGS